MEKHKSFIVYKDWEEYVGALDSDEEAGKLFKALFAFALRGETPEFSGALKMAFIVMKNTLERDGLKWEKTCQLRSEAGKRGGRPSKDADGDEPTKANAFSEKQTKAKKAIAFSEKQTKAKKADNDNENENVNENDSVNDNVHEQTYGRHTRLTEKEYSELCRKYGDDIIVSYIRKIDDWLDKSGKKPYNNHYSTILDWLYRDGIKERPQPAFDISAIMEHAIRNIPKL